MTSWCMPRFSGETRAEACPRPELLSFIRRRNTAAAALASSDWLNEFQGFYCLWLSQTFVSHFTLLKEGVSQVPGGLFLFGQNSSDVFGTALLPICGASLLRQNSGSGGGLWSSRRGGTSPEPCVATPFVEQIAPSLGASSAEGG